MRCVGYRQVWEALDQGLDLSQPAVRAEVAERGAAATRQLAKRQITWLRSERDSEWLDPRQGGVALERTVERLCSAVKAA